MLKYLAVKEVLVSRGFDLFILIGLAIYQCFYLLSGCKHGSRLLVTIDTN